MGESRQPLLGDLFGGCDALAVTARRRLAALVAVPGRAPALLHGELVAQPLPPGADERVAVRQTVKAGLGPDALARLAGQRFGEVVPAIRQRDGGIASVPCPGRLRNLLDRNQATSWAVLAELTLAEIGAWHDAGPVTTASLIDRAIEAGLVFLAHEEAARPSPTNAPAATAADVALLLRYEHDEGGEELRRAIERLTGDQHPEETRAAAGRLLASPTEPRHHPCLVFLDRVLDAAGDERDRAVFEHLALAPERRVRKVQIATALDIGTERVRQLRTRAEDRVRAALEQGPATVHRLAADLADRLGAAAPIAAVDEALDSWRLPPRPDSRSLLLLWLAGAYGVVADHPDWVATAPAELVAETRRLLREDGGVRPTDQIVKELDALGLAEGHMDAWLAEQSARVVDGLVVDTTGSSAEVAERALFALGRSMTVEEISSWVGLGGREVGAAGLWSLLMGDGRFVRVGPDQFELAEWGSERYDGIASLAEGSMSTRGRCAGGRTWLRIEVDGGVLAGSWAPVPVPFLESLGVRRGGRRTFATRYGPVALAYDAGQPSRGSLRPVALAAGASAGDAILLGFHPHEDGALVELVRAGATSAATV